MIKLVASSTAKPTRDSNNFFIGTNDAARLLSVGLSTIQRWIDSGEIPAHRTLGGHRRIRMRDLIEVAQRKHFPLFDHPSPQRGTVLIVDDEPDVTETLAVRIRGHRPDLTVLTAESGFKAGLIVRSCTPGLILLDIRMPGMNGIDVCRMIRSDSETAASHVVGITAYRDPSEVNALKSAGATDVFFKPFDPDALMALVDRLLPRVEASPRPSPPSESKTRLVEGLTP